MATDSKVPVLTIAQYHLIGKHRQIIFKSLILGLTKMKDFDFAIVTPSYPPDFERCKLLAWSIQQFVQPSVTHYIVVKKKDYPLFKQLKGPKTEIVIVESIIPPWLVKIPFTSNGWLSLKTPPVRNWLLQQIVKICAGRHIKHDVLVYIDSDFTFVRPFDLRNFVKGDKVRLFHAEVEGEPDNWDKSASKILSLPQAKFPNYVNALITWRHDNVLKMFDYIEDVTGRGTIENICHLWHFSEYVLYGAFVDYVLKEESGHYWDAYSPCKEYWEHSDMSQQDLERFFHDLEPEHAAVMVSSKAGIAAERYANLVQSMPLVC